MLLLNFGHPLTEAQLSRIRELSGEAIDRVVTVPTQFDHDRSFEEQVAELVDSAGLTREEWQTASLVINPPALAPIAAVLFAEIHGRAGYFPTIARLRPVSGATPPRFEVAELLNLQRVRDSARGRRGA